MILSKRLETQNKKLLNFLWGQEESTQGEAGKTKWTDVIHELAGGDVFLYFTYRSERKTQGDRG